MRVKISLIFLFCSVIVGGVSASAMIGGGQSSGDERTQEHADTREELMKLLTHEKQHVLSDTDDQKYAERFMKASEGENVLQEVAKSDDRELRDRVAGIIRYIDKDWTYQLLVRLALEDPEDSVRTMALRSLTYHKKRSPEKVLIQALADAESDNVRLSAARHLAGFHTDEVVDALINTVEKDSSKMVQYHAVSALGETRSKKVLPLLYAILRKGGIRPDAESYDANGYIVLATVEALCKIDAPGASEEIVKIVLGDNTWRKDHPWMKEPSHEFEFGSIIIDGFRHFSNPWIANVLDEIIKKSSNNDLVKTAKEAKDEFLKRQEELKKQEKEKAEKIRK